MFVRYIIEGAKDKVNEARGEEFVIKGFYDLEFMSVTEKRLTDMIPIEIPIYRGLLGLRLALTRKNDLRLSAVSDLSGLRKFVGGHGTHWSDLPVYQANGLKVVTNVSYENLFKMLIHKRFDYFHKGINEISGELDRYKNDLQIADSLMIFYKHVVYFLVNKKQVHLAKDIEKGLKIALSDGSFRNLFLKTHEAFLKNGRLNGRNLIILNNPRSPTNLPPLDTSWWAPKEVQEKIAKAGY
ncbi:MAG: hypothetical protein HRU09_21070 [Oligoflexales bacterium]|nr:hypothetical protein [Oligoflexales bacterium]